jgi:hypothetical protein
MAENGWGPTKNSRGGESVAWMFRLGLAAYNLVRLGKLVSDFAAICPRAYRNEQSLIFPVPFGQSCVFLKQRIAFIPDFSKNVPSPRIRLVERPSWALAWTDFRRILHSIRQAEPPSIGLRDAVDDSIGLRTAVPLLSGWLCGCGLLSLP